jgi:hypothetical protein
MTGAARCPGTGACGPCGVGDALEGVDAPVPQAGEHVRPAAEPKLDPQAHHLGDGRGQVDVEAGGVAVAVQKLVGRIVAIAADDHHGRRSRDVGAGRQRLASEKDVRKQQEAREILEAVDEGIKALDELKRRKAPIAGATPTAGASP